MTTRRVLTCAEARDLAPLFVTGALEPSEMADVRDHLAGCSDPHLEMLEYGEAATALFETVDPVEPPARLKAGLMAAAAADLAEGQHRATAGVAAPAGVRVVAPAAESTSSPVSTSSGVASAPAPASGTLIDFDTARNRRRGRLASLVAVAAVIAVLALGALNVGLRRDLDAAQAYQDSVNQALELAAQPGSVTALLASEDGSVSGFSVVGADGTVRMTMQGLPATTGSEVYTAWAIEGEGDPVPIGEFTVDASGVATAGAQSPTAAPGALLALTLEPAPGATTPTLPIVASGVTTAPAG